MKKLILFLVVCSLTCVLYGADFVAKDGVKAWSDRDYLISGLTGDFSVKNPVPIQSCGSFKIKFPTGTRRALVAMCANDGANAVAATYKLQAFPGELFIGKGSNPKMLKYRFFIAENPPAVMDCRPTRAGAILLAVNEDVPQISAAATAGLKSVPLAALPAGLNGVIKVPGQEYRFRPGAREFEVYVRTPRSGVNSNTGIMLLSHNWGGTWKLTAGWCDLLSDRYNLICLSVNYLQSGETDHSKGPYDHGVLQAMDCLRALYAVQKTLDDNKIAFNRKRIYAGGASGGGNVSLMANKLAPSTFACTVDLCGMPGLTNDIAFGVGKLNAGYSKDPASEKYLTVAMQEIRDPGNMAHLAIQKRCNPNNLVVIVHGLDDNYCNPADKMLIAANMVRSGFRPDTHFLTQHDIDGIAVTNTGHGIGNRPEVITKYAHDYLAENGRFAALIPNVSDLDAKHEIVYPVTGGKYIVSFKSWPEIRFEK